MKILISFAFSAMAGIVANCICKWFDRNDNGNEPKD